MAQRKHANHENETEQHISPMEMLKADHQKVKELFDKYEAAGDRQSKAKQGYVRDTCNFVLQRGSSSKVSFLGQPIVSMFGLENQ
jgi:hypothetical protein